MVIVAGMASVLPSAYAGGKITSDDPDRWISIGVGLRAEFVAAQEHASANGGELQRCLSVSTPCVSM